MTLPANGGSVDEVTQELLNRGFVVQREPEPSDEREGTVLSLNPVGQVLLGTTITVNFSNGTEDEEPYVIPVDIVGQQAEPRVQEITEAGVNVLLYEIVEKDTDIGTILDTNPDGGSTVQPGDTVEVWIAVEATDSPSPTDGN